MKRFQCERKKRRGSTVAQRLAVMGGPLQQSPQVVTGHVFVMG
jgi:hypothetical protein